MKSTICGLLLAMFCTLVGAEPYVFVTGSGAQIKAKVGDGLSESARALSIVGGYRFNKYIAAEVDYLQTGRVHSEDADRFQGTSRFATIHLFEAKGLGVSAVGRWPVAERLALLGKLGVHQLSLKHTAETLEASAASGGIIAMNTSTTTEQVFVPVIALGAEFSAARQVQLRLMLEEMAGRGTLERMRLLSGSVVFSF